jgi:nicotinamide-nucleotide amidase
MGITAAELLTELRAKGLTLITAESCTGGMIGAALTDIPGSSDVVEGGFITYSNRMKTLALGVPEAMLETYGAVSEEVACAMAKGALEHSKADLSIAVTGIAGPDGGTSEKPVGLVYIAVCKRGNMPHCRKEVFSGDRAAVRRKALECALNLISKNAG